jgi:hypothetical protein
MDVMWNLLNKLEQTLFCFVKIKLINLYKYVHSQLLKRTDNKASHFVPLLEEYGKCIII